MKQVSVSASTIVMFAAVAVLVLSPEFAFAQGAFDPTAKLGQLLDWIQGGAAVIATMAVVFCGLKFMYGDQQAMRQGLMVVIGASLVFGATAIIEWLRH